MTIVTSYDGRRGCLSRVIPYFATWSIRLFVNDLWPRPDDDATSFLEASFDGYRALSLKTWSSVYLNTRFEGETVAPPQVWTVGTGGGVDEVFGYYMTDPDGRVMLSERDHRGPQPMDSPGTIYRIVPKIDLGPLIHSNVRKFRDGLRVGGAFGP